MKIICAKEILKSISKVVLNSLKGTEYIGQRLTALHCHILLVKDIPSQSFPQLPTRTSLQPPGYLLYNATIGAHTGEISPSKFM